MICNANLGKPILHVPLTNLVSMIHPTTGMVIITAFGSKRLCGGKKFGLHHMKHGIG